MSVKDSGVGIESCQVKDPSYRPRRIHHHDRVATLTSALISNGWRSYPGRSVEPRPRRWPVPDHDPVDSVLKILNSRQVELASKQKISCWRDLDVKVARAVRDIAPSRIHGVERATGQAGADGPRDVDSRVCA